MATLGNVPAEAYTNTVKDSFSGNGSATAFTMSLPTVTNDVRVVVENVIQDPTVAYSVSGTTLTFTSAPPTGTNNIYVVHLGPAVMTTVPPAEIADATTFASSLTVQGAFTSPGIDDNADAVALTIDSSENVFIGKTSAGLSTAGVQLDATGSGGFCRAETCLTLSRLSTEGSILDFRKDTTTVGTIGTGFGQLVIGQSNTSVILDNSNTRFAPSNADGSGNDGNTTLGWSNRRWSDLYLSGGVYLGGTGSANKLEDYETGTFTPAISGLTFTTAAGLYVKVGRACHVTINMEGANTSKTGDIYISGLPFTAITNSSLMPANSVPIMEVANVSLTGSYINMYGRVNSGDTRLQLLQSAGTAHASMAAGGGISSGGVLRTSFTYQTA